MPRLELDPKFPSVIASSGFMTENMTGNWRSLRPVIDLNACTGCLLCWKFCPEACVDLQKERPVIDLGHCKGCGICAKECPPHCIQMNEEAQR